MKKLALVLAAILITTFCTPGFAATKNQRVYISPLVYQGIAKYKKQNYTGCLQDMKNALAKNPNDTYAQYYLALAYTRIGMQKEAKSAYQKVVDLNKDIVLVGYSKKALKCIGTKQGCKEPPVKEDDMTKFIKSGEFVHPALKKQIQTKELDSIKDNINGGNTIDTDNYYFLNNAKDAQPTNEEIANAVRVLAKVGFNPFAQNAMNSAAYAGIQNPQIAQLNALMGQTSSNGNNFANLLPYLMAQNTNGSNASNINPQLIQTMMLNSMMPDLGFNSSKD